MKLLFWGRPARRGVHVGHVLMSAGRRMWLIGPNCTSHAVLDIDSSGESEDGFPVVA